MPSVSSILKQLPPSIQMSMVEVLEARVDSVVTWRLLGRVMMWVSRAENWDVVSEGEVGGGIAKEAGVRIFEVLDPGIDGALEDIVVHEG